MTTPERRRPLRIVTDSTADLPPEMVLALGITVVPLTVQFGEEVYRDGVDIGVTEFYRRLLEGPVLPRTSQPAPGDFAAAYRAAAAEGDVLSLHVSSKLSGTYNAALLGRQEVVSERPYAGARIEVIDTLQVSMALGLLAMEAARQAQAGASLEEAAAWVRAAVPRTRILFLVDTLEYLAKGGRIGRAQAFLGGLLSVKPLLEVRDGEVHPLERARTRPRALERLTGLALAEAPAERAIVAGSTDLESAAALAERLRAGLGLDAVPVFQIGAVIGTYAGPGCVGVCVLKK